MSATAPTRDEPVASGVREPVRRRSPDLADRVIYRWTAITTVMAALLLLYTQHPYYRSATFAPWRPIYVGAFIVWLVVGRAYVKRTLVRFHEMRYVMRDSGLHLLLLAKAFREKRLRRVLKSSRIRTTVLAIAVKAFFTPLMAGFLSNHVNGIATAWMRHVGKPPVRFDIAPGLGSYDQAAAWLGELQRRLPDFVPHAHDFAGLLAPATWTIADWNWGLGLAYDVIFFVDCAWAFMGYASESRWLGNKTRSVEPTPFGWLVCLCCYPPYNSVLGTYLPFADGGSLVSGAVPLLVIRGVTVALFAIYASATVSFGFKFSNLTNRGIVTRGPYRLIRHPAYVCKCLAWWCEHIPRLSIQTAIFLSLQCGVYALRAWTEERHLSRDPDYQAYRAKVRWVLVPGIY